MLGVILRVIAFILFYQARQLVGQPNRKRAFILGGVALLCFTVFNASISLGVELGILQQLTALAGMILFVGSAISLVLSLRNGERSSVNSYAMQPSDHTSALAW